MWQTALTTAESHEAGCFGPQDNRPMTERTMNARQLEVLNWIVDGCPEGVMNDTTHKTTAKALKRRRLATVSSKGSVWRAAATDAGRYFAKYGQYPAGHWSTGTKHRARSPSPPPDDGSGPDGRHRVTGRRPVDQFIADLVESGGEVTVEAHQDGYWEGLASSANRYNKVPDGKVLKVERGTNWMERVIRLEDAPDWMTVDLDPIPVAQQLNGPHPTVKSLRDDRSRLAMRGETRARALRILDAIAKASVTRGYGVDAPQAERGYRYPKGYLRVTIRGYANTVDLSELSDKVPHEATAKELRELARDSWRRIPTYDEVPSGRLRLKLLSGWAVRQDVFVDTKTITLEDRLPIVLHEMELRAAREEDRDQRAEREREERQREWERVHAAAKTEARDAHRAKVLMGQVEHWRQANEIDAYLRAMAAQIEALEGEEQITAMAWLDWTREFRERIDPLGQRLAMPPDPEFTTDALAPFMRGLSPYGPAT
jgi:hypothetical protein